MSKKKYIFFLNAGVCVDEILVSSGRKRVFIPFMGNLVNQVLGEPKIETLTRMGETYKTQITSGNESTAKGSVEEVMRYYNSLNASEQEAFINELKKKGEGS